MHQNHLAARTLWALGIAALLVACANSGYSGTVTPSGVGPGSQTRLAQIGADIPPPEQRTPRALGQLVSAEIDKWVPLIKAAGVTAQ